VRERPTALVNLCTTSKGVCLCVFVCKGDLVCERDRRDGSFCVPY